MPIDYVDDPAGQPDAPRASGRAAPPEGRRIEVPPAPLDPGEREAVHRAHWARVARAARAGDGDGDAFAGERGAAVAAADAWSRAAPGLRASWEEHEAHYPDHDRPVPQTRPDGSWFSGDSRKLSPDENLEASKACADLHDEGQRLILPAMRRVEGADPQRRLAGLEHMLKSADRIKEKIAERLRYRPDLTPRRAAADVPDAVRFTLAYSQERYTDGVLADVGRLKAEGCELLKLKNLWAKEQYKGVNSQWRWPETGLRFEVQFHTPESREAKELTHKAYERLRDPLTSRNEEMELEDFQRRVNAFIKSPPDVFMIEDHPPEKRDG